MPDAINQRHGQIVGKGDDKQRQQRSRYFCSRPCTAVARHRRKPKLPFTLSKQTTAITSPLNPDGTPDYIGAFNQRYSQGVTPDNNGFALWLQIAGNAPAEPGYFINTPHRDERIPDELWLRLVALSGATNVPETPPWLYFSDFLVKEKGYSAQAATDKYNEIFLRWTLWTPEQQPELAEYLKRIGPLLDKTAEAAQRPQWFEPAVSTDQWMLNQTSPAATLYLQREACRVLSVRAMMRAKAGDFDGFMHDAMSVERFGLHLSFAWWNRSSPESWACQLLKPAIWPLKRGRKHLEYSLKPQCEAAFPKALADLPASGDPMKSSRIFKTVGRCSMKTMPVALGRTDVIREGAIGRTPNAI